MAIFAASVIHETPFRQKREHHGDEHRTVEELAYIEGNSVEVHMERMLRVKHIAYYVYHKLCQKVSYLEERTRIPRVKSIALHVK